MIPKKNNKNNFLKFGFPHFFPNSVLQNQDKSADGKCTYYRPYYHVSYGYVVFWASNPVSMHLLF